MGKIKSRFPVGSFYLKMCGNDQGVIHLRYHINGRYVSRSTGMKVDSKMWDKKGQKIKGSTNPRINNINNQNNLILQETKSNIDKQIHDYEGLLTYEVVGQILNGDLNTKEKLIKETDFIEYCQNLYKQRYDQGKISYSYWYNKSLVINHFRDFFKGKYHRETISLCELNSFLFEEYKTYRITKKKNCPESVNKSLVPLFEGIKDLYENCLIEPVVYKSIYGKYESTKTTVYDPVVKDKTIRYLNPEQLNEFVQIFKNTKRQKTYEYMMMFLFSVNTGLRISDVVTLEWSHIDFEEKLLKKNMVKTKEVVEIYLNPTAMEILNRWKKWNRNPRFVFNLMKEDIDFKDSQRVHNTIYSKNRIIQTSLRSIGEKMNLPFHLTFHVARHTFAVFALRQNPNIYEVSKYLGHTSVRSTERTYAEFLPEDYKTTFLRKIDFGITLS